MLSINAQNPQTGKPELTKNVAPFFFLPGNLKPFENFFDLCIFHPRSDTSFHAFLQHDWTLACIQLNHHQGCREPAMFLN